MQLTAKKPDLQRAIALCNAIIERRSTIPILQTMRLSQDGSDLTITATDMDMELSVTVPASFTRGQHEPITLQAQTLADIVKKAASDHISISARDQAAVLNAGNATFRLGMLDAADFPVFDDKGQGKEFQISIGDMGALIKAVRYAVSTEQVRHYLCGIYFTTHDPGGDQMLRAVATDGSRLGRMDAPSIDASLESFTPVIVPAKACDALAKILEEGAAPTLAAAFSQKTASFTLPGVVFKTKLVDGTFPDYERVIPTGNSRRARLTTAALSEAVARVSCISDASKAVKLSFSGKDLIVSAKSPEGSADEKVDVTEWTGGPLDIGFNSGYLLATLAQMGAETELLMADPGSPVLLYSLDGPDPDPARLDLIMPMRV